MLGTPATAVRRPPNKGRKAAGYATAAAAVGFLIKAAAVSGTSEAGLADIIVKALQKAVKSGSAGFVAGTMQVLAFMWLRTVMNYQYKFGGTMSETIAKLWKEGGIARLYRGLFPWAIFQNPLSRFGDVVANDLVLGISSALFPQIPVGVVTILGSFSSGVWRMIITPIDTCKTILQTDGEQGMVVLRKKVAEGGITVLWAGWEGNYLANVIGNYPWFVTMNALQNIVPIPQSEIMKLVRNAACGAMASSVSDVTSNSIRVIKTKKQTHESNIGYVAAAKEVVDSDGLSGLFFRGLETRIAVNVMQGAFFTVMWKYISTKL